MDRSIRDYVSEEMNISYRQILVRFGTPKQIASTYISEMETEELLSNLRIGKRILKFIAVSLYAIIIIVMGYVAISYIDHRKDVNGYAVVDIIEIERKVICEGE